MIPPNYQSNKNSILAQHNRWAPAIKFFRDANEHVIRKK
jgi:hypothetical protein